MTWHSKRMLGIQTSPFCSTETQSCLMSKIVHTIVSKYNAYFHMLKLDVWLQSNCSTSTYLEVFELDYMRMTHSLQDFNLCEKVFCWGLVESFLPYNFHCHHFSTVPLLDHNEELRFHSLKLVKTIKTNQNRKLVNLKKVILIRNI